MKDFSFQEMLRRYCFPDKNGIQPFHPPAANSPKTKNIFISYATLKI
jgi:hypothetical protein